MSNTIQGGAGVDIISAGNGNNIISGGGEANVAATSQFHDVIQAGNGRNQIYADTQIDLASALANQKTATATNHQGAFIGVADGNNTIVGGNGCGRVAVCAKTTRRVSVWRRPPCEGQQRGLAEVLAPGGCTHRRTPRGCNDTHVCAHVRCVRAAANDALGRAAA